MATLMKFAMTLKVPFNIPEGVMKKAVDQLIVLHYWHEGIVVKVKPSSEINEKLR